MKFGAIFALGSTGSIALAVALGLLANPAHSGVNPPSDRAKVLVQEMRVTDDMRRLLVPAKVEANVSSAVAAEVEGFVTAIKKPLGTRVKEGDVVLYVENKDPAFTYAKVPVTAPVTGVVSQMNATLMTRVSRGDRLFVVTDPKSLKVTAEIPGADLALVQPGYKGVFKENLDDSTGPAIRVTGVTPFVDPRTGTASAELAFTGSKNLPAIGSVGHALFEMSRGKVLLVPESALGYTDGKPTVKVLGPGSVVKRKSVELGEQKESQLVVKHGLEAGEKVIVRSSRSVRDGETVDVESSAKLN